MSDKRISISKDMYFIINLFKKELGLNCLLETPAGNLRFDLILKRDTVTISREKLGYLIAEIKRVGTQRPVKYLHTLMHIDSYVSEDTTNKNWYRLLWDFVNEKGLREVLKKLDRYSAIHAIDITIQGKRNRCIILY